MKTIYKSLFTLLCAVAVSSTAFGAQILVKTMPLGEGITTTGFVRVVVKVTDQHIGKDLGVILHEPETYPLNWDSGIALMMFEQVIPVAPEVPYPQVRGYDGLVGTNGSFIATAGTKNISRGTTIALWFSVDITNGKYGLFAQTSTETTPAQVFADYQSRTVKKNYAFKSNAKFCSVFVNDVANATLGGTQNTTAAIEVISDAVIVSSVDAYTFTGLFSNKASDNLVKVNPTLADDFIQLSSDEEISSVKIYSMLGKVVYEAKAVNKISISNLKSGSYIVEAKTINNKTSRNSFLKK